MEVVLARDWPTLVRIERTAFGSVLDKYGPDEVAADKYVDPSTEMSDITLDGGVLDDCVLLEGVLRGCKLLGCELLGFELDKGIFDEDMLGNCALDEILSDKDRLETSVLDVCILREAWLDETLLGNPPVVPD